MALDQSALLEVLEALTVAEVGDRVRQAAETIYQALIEAELTAVIGAALGERTETHQLKPARDLAPSQLESRRMPSPGRQINGMALASGRGVAGPGNVPRTCPGRYTNTSHRPVCPRRARTPCTSSGKLERSSFEPELGLKSHD